MEPGTVPPKRKRSALVMVVIFVLAMLAGRGAIAIVRYLTGTLVFEGTDPATGNAGNSAMTSPLVPVIAFLGLALIVGYGLVMFSLWVQKGDDSHFGTKGAVRWALAGITFAVLIQPAAVLIPRPGSARSPWLAGLYQVLRAFWGVLAFELTYHLVFKWRPLARGQRIPPPGDMGEQTAPDGLGDPQRAKSGNLLAMVRQNPQARQAIQAASWFLIAGGVLMLLIGLTTTGLTNPHLLPSLVVMAVASVVTGVAVLLYLRQSRIALALMFLSCLLLAVFLYLFVQALI